MRTRALIDSGAEINLASNRLVSRTDSSLHKTTISLVGVSGKVLNTARSTVSLKLLPRDTSSTPLTITAAVIPNLELSIPRRAVNLNQWPHLRGIDLADPSFMTPGPIDLLLGADVYAQIIRDGVRRGPDGTPTAQNSTFGWLTFGGGQSVVRDASVSTVSITSEDPLTTILHRFWCLEEVTSKKPMSIAEEDCERQFVTGLQRQDSGRYMVRLPMKKPGLLPASGTLAAARRALMRAQFKMKNDPEFAREYCLFMDQYETLGHMQLVPEEELDLIDHRICYIPHHAIWQMSDQGRKFRVVFNASCQTGRGQSLNDCLHTGPPLQSDLVDVICKWRLSYIAAGADIEKMYRQILVDPRDADLQRIVWKAPGAAERHFRLLTVTYGMNCAPYLALRVLKQLAHDEAHHSPNAAKIIEESSYVDDILFGADDVATARRLRDELIEVTSRGGFPLHKWTASHPEVLDDLEEDVRLRPQWKDFTSDHPVKTLGIAWDPVKDEMRYRAPQLPDSTLNTKRAAFSIIARLFDPLGWVSPVFVTAKILMQDMWRDRLGWDDELPPHLSDRWQNFMHSLTAVSSIRIPRWIGATTSRRLQLHGFADASKSAYGAAVYAVTTTERGTKQSRLLISKTRVAPVKTQTIPRLELCATVLLATLLHKLIMAFGEQVSEVHAWTDSSVALAWINSESSRWEVFVANRVSQIQRLLPSAVWRHVISEDNPADLASRGLTAVGLVDCSLWWEGPSWLTQSAATWPFPLERSTVTCNVVLQAQRRDRPAPTTSEDDFIKRFSRLETLLRVIARCLRFTLLIRSGRQRTLAAAITADDLTRAFHACVRYVQQTAFNEEIAKLRQGHSLGRRNRLAALSPFLDTDGTLRVGGRLQNARLPYEQRHPVILPRKCHLGFLVIDRAHKMALHGGPMLTYAYTMRSAWIIGGKAQTRAHVRQCIVCAQARARPSSQLMGNLPSARVEPARPFARTGLDYAGPFSLKASVGRGLKSTKGYLAVFVCLSTKAVHLELVGDLTTASFFAALQRFAARKTTPREIWSDNATTFHGADAELRAMFREANLDWAQVDTTLASAGIFWHFIPPSAPHFGGLWEAAVKSAKSHLKKTIGERFLTYEEMSTIIALVESCLNSRPLTPLSGDVDDLQALTPWHLVTGFPPLSLPGPPIEPSENLDHLRHWELIKGMRDRFWLQWSQEYLHTLQQRRKWREPQPNIEVGSLVLVLDKSLLRHGRWPLGRVTAVHPGADGHVRVVSVKTAHGQYDRPITKIYALPLQQ